MIETSVFIQYVLIFIFFAPITCFLIVVALVYITEMREEEKLLAKRPASPIEDIHSLIKEEEHDG